VREFLLSALAGAALWSGVVRAGGDSLYVPVGDGALRADLRLLVDAGVIDLPLLAWPLSRADILRALESAHSMAEDDAGLQAALSRTRARFAPRARPRVELSAAAGRSGLLRDFDSPAREDGNLGLSVTAAGDRWSATAAVGGVTDPTDGHALRFDGSELTVRAGNWLLGINAMDRWWGPAQQGSLILSSNARPIPALVFDRATSPAPSSRVLHWIGGWRFTALVGQAEGDRRDVPRPYFMGMRFEMRPRPWLEFGAERTALFCGRGRSCGLDVVWKMLVGHDNVGINTGRATEPGDGLAGFDLRLRLPGSRLPAAFYTQWIGEDVHNYLPAKFLGLFGAEITRTTVSGATWRGFIEYSDTTCAFNTTLLGGTPRHFGCAYNSGIYNVEGYRYYGRSIGFTTDNDAQLWVVGLRVAPAAGGEWRGRIAGGTLNRDNVDPLAPDTLNTVASVATRYHAAEIAWQNDLNFGRLTAQLGIERRDPVGAGASDRAYGFLKWQRAL
jgi:hypothetical protein